MVPETHEIEFPSSDELRKFLVSDEFRREYAQKLNDQYVVEVTVSEPRHEKRGDDDVLIETLKLSYTRNNAGGLKDAIDFLLLPFMARGLETETVRGAIPRPKSDSFEDNMLFFESKLLQRAEPPVTRESPTRANFGEDAGSRSIFDKLRKPGSMSSFSSFIDRRRKNGSSPPNSLFMHASSNASKASLVSMESRDSGYRNPWNDSGIDLDHDTNTLHAHNVSGSSHGNGWGSFGASTSRPNTSSTSLSAAFETKFPFGANGNASTSSLTTPMIPGLGMIHHTSTGSSNLATMPTLVGAPGDTTPKYDAQARALDGLSSAALASDPPSATNNTLPASTTTTSAAFNSSGYPAPIGPLR